MLLKHLYKHPRLKKKKKKKITRLHKVKEKNTLPKSTAIKNWPTRMLLIYDVKTVGTHEVLFMQNVHHWVCKMRKGGKELPGTKPLQGVLH